MDNALTTQGQSAQTTELATITAMSADLEQVREVITENLGGGGMSQFDLQRITIPSGGGIAFTVTDLDGERPEAKLQAIILLNKAVRAYWKESVDEGGGGKPPDCHSDNQIVGVGDPGGICAECPMAQFGSADKGKGQACKQTKQLFILRSGSDSVIPEVLNIPPTSLKPLQKYGVMLAGRGVTFSGVITEIGLLRIPAAEGRPAYAQATFKPVRPLSAEERARIKQLADLFRPLVEKAITAPSEPGARKDPAW